MIAAPCPDHAKLTSMGDDDGAPLGELAVAAGIAEAMFPMTENATMPAAVPAAETVAETVAVVPVGTLRTAMPHAALKP